MITEIKIKMEIQIKKTVKAGNSSAVILPRAWLNKEVRIELIRKTSETILSETIDILKKPMDIKDVIGIYLVGSYARKEEDENSDIDILVITSDIDKEIIHEGIYNILIISKELLKQKLEQDLFPIGQMIKEAEPLLNSDYIKSINVNVTKRNVKWYLDTTEDKLKIIRKILDKFLDNNENPVDNKVVYTLVLRIRTFYIIDKLIKGKNYSKKDFIKLIEKISNGKNAYNGYLAIKNDLNKKNLASLEEVERLYNYLKDELIRIKKIIG